MAAKKTKKATAKALKPSVKKLKKAKKRIISATEKKLINKQTTFKRKEKKIKEEFSSISALYPAPADREKIIIYKGERKKVKTIYNSLVNEAAKIAKQYNKVTKRRVTLTRGKYKPKKRLEFSTEKEAEAISKTKGLVLAGEYMFFEVKNFEEDITFYGNKGYKFQGTDWEGSAEEVLTQVNSIFLELAAETEEGEYPQIVLYLDKKAKNMLIDIVK